eukprot:252917_1
MTESVTNTKMNKEKMTQIMFETFNVPSFYSAVQPLLALFANGRTNGLILDIGDNITHSVPINDSKCLLEGVKTGNYGGMHINVFLQYLLEQKGYSFTTTAELEILGDIKEKLGYIAEYDYDSELKYLSITKHLIKQSLIPGYIRNNYLDFNLVPNDVMNICGDYINHKLFSEHELNQNYELPDGQIITVSDEQFKCTEMVFDTKLFEENNNIDMRWRSGCLNEYKIDNKGIDKLINESILECGVDNNIQKELSQNIVLCGGSTMFDGIQKRLKNELKLLTKNEIKIIAPPERKYSVWIGGSILSSLSTFHEICIQKDEYDETG